MIPFLSRLTRSDTPRSRPSPRRFQAAVDALEDRRLLTFSINVNSIVVQPHILWPPNGQYVPVQISGTAVEFHYNGHTAPQVDLPGPKIGQYHVTDQYRQNNLSAVFPITHVSGPNFSFSFTVYLQAKRSTSFATGRHYFVAIGLSDSDGWAGHTVTVWVPKNLPPGFATTATTATAATHAK